MAINFAETKGLSSSQTSPELKGGDGLPCLFSRETSADEREQLRVRLDSLPSADSSCSEKDSAEAFSGDESDGQKDQAPCSDDAAINAISGVWWGLAGERYNVEKFASGLWRCVRRGPSIGSQRVFSMTTQAESGHVVWGKAFTLDTTGASEEIAWHSIKAINGKRRKFTWTRSKQIQEPRRLPFRPVSRSFEAQFLREEATDSEEGQGYSRSLMLRVRLQIHEAEQGNKPLAISCRGRDLLQQPRDAAVEAKPAAAAEAREEEQGNEIVAMTTVMLRNLPNQCTRGMLVKWLSTTEFDDQFDLVYVPVDRTSGNNLGYSFINFAEASTCERFIATVHGMKAAKCFPGSRSGKTLQCNYAKVQGKEPYCQGLANAANKLSAMGCNWAAAETLAPVPGQGIVLAPHLAMGLWCPTAEAKGFGEKTTTPSSTKFEGLRSDAPEFVPGGLASNVDTILEALTGMSTKDFSKSHAEAAARARKHSAKLCEDGGIFVPPRMAESEEPTAVH